VRRFVLVAALGLVLAATVAAPAFAFNEPDGLLGGLHGNVIEECVPCHRPAGAICVACHTPHPPLGEVAGKGPHGLYTTTTDRCDACHDLHDAAGPELLPAATIVASCNTCHDGTGGHGVYGAVFAQTGVDPAVSGGMHRIDTTNVVPGGDAENGGSATMTFRGPGTNLTCGDCHSPHDSNTVTAFAPERWRATYSAPTGLTPTLLGEPTKTSRLLKKRPGVATVDVPVYGADWCAACHQGRTSGGTVHNHPVEDSATPGAFSYDSVARLDSDNPTFSTVLGTLASSNRGYLMPFPRTIGPGGQEGHLPICQQCHEDTRIVGTLNGDVGDAASFVITAPDGAADTDNPRFQNFPHETQNLNMLVEQGDDLCLNCHPVEQLP